MAGRVKFFDRALAEGCLFFGAMLALLVGFAVALSSCPLAAQEPVGKQQDRDRKAKAALALAGASDPEKCDCTKDRVKPWKEAAALATMRRVPIVVYAGVEPRCCGEAIPVRMTVEEAALLRPEKPIVVYIPTEGGKVLQATDLPATATPQEIKAAVKLAQGQIDRRP